MGALRSPGLHPLPAGCVSSCSGVCQDQTVFCNWNQDCASNKVRNAGFHLHPPRNPPNDRLDHEAAAPKQDCQQSCSSRSRTVPVDCLNSGSLGDDSKQTFGEDLFRNSRYRLKMSTSAMEVSPRRRRRRFLSGYGESAMSIKKEPDDDIKDYAETTMNELLGWYGYEKVDSKDTQGLNLQHFASTSSANAGASPMYTPEGSGSEDPTHGGGSRPPSGSRAASTSPTPDGAPLASDAVGLQQQQMVSTLSSVPKHPGSPESPNLPPGCIVCAWCQKVGMKLFTLKTPTGCKAFCSELCFTQCRRASFKKNKVCDWCKHVRHTVNYVDFQDGEQQLQFCSDKCLNQYKMNIFCKETQAHLQMHTHLKEAACKMAAGNGPVNLITPDLWLRDCKPQSNGNSYSSNDDAQEELFCSESSHPVRSPVQIPSAEVLRLSASPTENKQDTRTQNNRMVKDREKILRRAGKSLSRHSSHRKNGTEIKPLHHSRHRNRILSETSNVNPSVVESSPTSISRKPQINGPSPGHPSPPSGTSTRRHHHIHQKQAHFGPHLPPPLRMSMEHARPQIMPPNFLPPPLHLFTQQHMEAFLRAQHSMDVRPSAPPFPFPPWVMPPFPHAPPPPPPPIGPTTSSIPPLSHHPTNFAQQHPNPPQPRQSMTNGSHVQNSQSTPSLLPPVTVMVPFPIVLPIPLPIPIPIPIPSNIMEKFRKQKESLNEQNTLNSGGTRKRKDNNMEEFLIDTSDSDDVSIPKDAVNQADGHPKPMNSVIKIVQRSGRSSPENSLRRGSNSAPPSPDLTLNAQRLNHKNSDDAVECPLTDLDSRSFSPLSEIGTTDDDNITGDDIADSEAESQNLRPSFSTFVDSSHKSSLPSFMSGGHYLSRTNNRRDPVRYLTPSPLLSVEKRHSEDLSSTSMAYKRKCNRDPLNMAA